MFTLSDPLVEEVEIDGKICRLNLFFDTVLLFFDLWEDDSFFDEEKIEIAFEMFIDTDKEFDFETKCKAIEEIIRRFIMEEKDEETKASGGGKGGKRVYDLKQDAEFIYASFLQDYGIDLIEEQGKLRWEKFKALLVGLRENTKFKEVVGIRTMEVPSGKGMEKERKRILELKRAYSLKKEPHTQEEKLDAIASMIMGGIRNGNQD